MASKKIQVTLNENDRAVIEKAAKSLNIEIAAIIRAGALLLSKEINEGHLSEIMIENLKKIGVMK